ncbi:MAG: hypothetical protein NVS4B13_00150 [Candidatus Elarobacter sp.]
MLTTLVAIIVATALPVGMEGTGSGGNAAIDAASAAKPSIGGTAPPSRTTRATSSNAIP